MVANIRTRAVGTTNSQRRKKRKRVTRERVGGQVNGNVIAKWQAGWWQAILYLGHLCIRGLLRLVLNLAFVHVPTMVAHDEVQHPDYPELPGRYCNFDSKAEILFVVCSLLL